MLALLGRLLELPLNLDCLLTSGPLLPSFAKATLHALDHCNSLEADEPSMTIGGEASSRLSMLLQVWVCKEGTIQAKDAQGSGALDYCRL